MPEPLGPGLEILELDLEETLEFELGTGERERLGMGKTAAGRTEGGPETCGRKPGIIEDETF